MLVLVMFQLPKQQKIKINKRVGGGGAHRKYEGGEIETTRLKGASDFTRSDFTTADVTLKRQERRKPGTRLSVSHSGVSADFKTSRLC